MSAETECSCGFLRWVLLFVLLIAMYGAIGEIRTKCYAANATTETP